MYVATVQPGAPSNFALSARRRRSRGMGVTYVGAPSATPAQVQSLIVNAAAQYGIPGLAQTALAVASHESQFLPNVKNDGSSAAGVMQLVSGTQSTLGVTDPYDASQNVNAGVSLLARYYQQYNSWPLALQAYSDGPGTVNAGAPPSAQTVGLVNYVQNFDPSGILASIGAPDAGSLDLASLFSSDSGGLLADPVTYLVGGTLVFLLARAAFG